MSTAETTEQRLARLGIELPEAPVPVAAFKPFIRTGSTVYVSGQIATDADGKLVSTGKLGAEVDVAGGQEAARTCALNLLAQLRAAAGSLDAVARIVKVTVFVASTPEFTQQPQVANGTSELLVEVFGDAGAHARSAVGVASLPLNTPVEIEAIAELTAAA
ncbi:RidA family protein [Actinomycetes bacterium KLBMP 9759]